jgi:hypothetical protein
MNTYVNRAVGIGKRSLVLLVPLVLIVTLAGAPPLVAALGAADRVNIRVWPTTSMAPAHFLVRVIIERNAANRWIKVTAESADYYGSSEGQLDGERSSRLRVVQFREVPPGSYQLRAVVFDQNGDVTGSAQASAIVIGR